MLQILAMILLFGGLMVLLILLLLLLQMVLASAVFLLKRGLLLRGTLASVRGLAIIMARAA